MAFRNPPRHGVSGWVPKRDLDLPTGYYEGTAGSIDSAKIGQKDILNADSRRSSVQAAE